MNKMHKLLQQQQQQQQHQKWTSRILLHRMMVMIPSSQYNHDYQYLQRRKRRRIASVTSYSSSFSSVLLLKLSTTMPQQQQQQLAPKTTTTTASMSDCYYISFPFHNHQNQQESKRCKSMMIHQQQQKQSKATSITNLLTPLQSQCKQQQQQQQQIVPKRNFTSNTNTTTTLTSTSKLHTGTMKSSCRIMNNEDDNDENNDHGDHSRTDLLLQQQHISQNHTNHVHFHEYYTQKRIIIQERFDSYCNEQGEFPIFPKEILQQFPSLTMSNKTTIPSSSSASSAVLVLLCPIVVVVKGGDNMKHKRNENDLPTAPPLIYDWCVLITKRSKQLNHHASELSFPGGHYEHDVDQNNYIHTALRETIEELFHDHHGNDHKNKEQQPIDTMRTTTATETNSSYTNKDINHDHWMMDPLEFKKNVHIIGTCTPIPSLRGKSVTPVVAVYQQPLFTRYEKNQKDSSSSIHTVTSNTDEEQQQHDPQNNNPNHSNCTAYPCHNLEHIFPGNPKEVDHVFAVPVTHLLHNESQYDIYINQPEEDDSIINKKKNRFGLRYTPMYPTPYGPIWGLTAFILQPLVKQIFSK